MMDSRGRKRKLADDEEPSIALESESENSKIQQIVEESSKELATALIAPEPSDAFLLLLAKTRVEEASSPFLS